MIKCATCGKEITRAAAWQRFTLLRHLGTKGGGRQRTRAGRGLEEYLCDGCARGEDDEVRGFARPGELAL